MRIPGGRAAALVTLTLLASSCTRQSAPARDTEEITVVPVAAAPAPSTRPGQDNSTDGLRSAWAAEAAGNDSGWRAEDVHENEMTDPRRIVEKAAARIGTFMARTSIGESLCRLEA